MQPADEVIPVSSLSDSKRHEVVAQLEAILASSLFRQSKRYPAFLRYVVETTLAGNDEQLKERTIGMEVFGRPPHYDTSLDPTVRLTAAEVRKRLAQYYQQPEHALEVHIALHPGSYVPDFSWRVEATQLETAHPRRAAATMLDASLIDPPVLIPHLPRQHLWRIGSVAVAAIVLAGIAFFVLRASSKPANARSVWAPLLADPNSVSIVLPDLSKSEYVPQPRETEKTSVLLHIRNNQLVDFNDSVALAHLSGMLGRWNKPYGVLLSSDATFQDLQHGPTILIGAVDNPWTMRFLQTLPYSIARKGDSMTFDIVGKGSAAQHGWSMDLTQPFEKVQQDFGILARQTDTLTGRPVLIVAGLGQNGTAAGIRLLDDPALESQILTAAPKGWSGRNFEIVFRMQIIDDKFGPPFVVAREYW